MNEDPSEIQGALRAASDGLLIAIREVDAREKLKRGVLPGSPDFGPLARAVTIAAEAVLALAQQEEARADETSGKPRGASLPTIEESPPSSDLAGILADWRAVERHLGAVDQGSPEAAQLMKEFERHRDRYATLVKGRQARVRAH